MINQILGQKIVAIVVPLRDDGVTILKFENGMSLSLGACESIEIEVPARNGEIHWSPR